MAESVSLEYNQESKINARLWLIEHAVTSLTTERSTSVCVKRDHVKRVWRQLRDSDEAKKCFPKIAEVEKQIGDWELFHDSKVQKKKASDLRVCYLAGGDPTNDLKVFVDKGVLCQNVFAIEKNSKDYEKAWNAIKNSRFRNLSLVKEDILTFLKEDKAQFDIIYLDACGSLPSPTQKTLKVVGYVFLHNKLASPGALITNFSFPPKATQQENSPNSQDSDTEKDMINFLVKEYMNYRLYNVSRKDNSPELGNNPEGMKKRTDEDDYGDYVSFQVIDSAYLFIPAQKMLMSGKKHPWGKVFNEKKHFLEEINSYSSANVEGATKGTNEESTKTKGIQELMEALKNLKVEEELKALQEKFKVADEVHPSNNLFSDLKTMAETFLEKSNNSHCKAWIKEIFPDWTLEKSLNKEKIPTMLLTPLLISSPIHIIYFSDVEFVLKGLGPLFNAVYEKKFPFCCNDFQQTCLLAGLLCGQMTYPSFPVMNKLLRLRYTAKERQMFADVFVFDKCQYVYDQFVKVDTACFPIEDLELQIVFRMAVDGLRKHLEGICFEDLFKFCHVASKDATTEGGVSFPERKTIEDILRKERQT